VDGVPTFGPAWGPPGPYVLCQGHHPTLICTRIETGETEAQREPVSGRRSHASSAAVLGLEPGTVPFVASAAGRPKHSRPRARPFLFGV
jgi:hypothetical protein